MFNGTTGARRNLVVPVTAYAAFGLVMSAVEALAVRGQLDFGFHVLGLRSVWLVVPPVALEAGALTCAALALWVTLKPRPSWTAMVATRVMTAVMVAAAAGANWLGAEAAGRSTTAAAYLAGASLMALAMWHVILHGVRHDDLDRAGQLEQPLPRFRLLRWVVAREETNSAFKLAVREGITSPAEAIARVRGDVSRPASSVADAAEQPDDDPRTLATKRLQVAWAVHRVEAYDHDKVSAVLGEYGIRIDPSYVLKIIKAMQADQRRQLRAVEEA